MGDLAAKPMNHLKRAIELYPDTWRMVEGFVAERGKGIPLWPSWCLMPMPGWQAVVTKASQDSTATTNASQDHRYDAARLAAIASWRYEKGVYSFESNFLKTTLSGMHWANESASTLLNLPQWSVYVATPNMVWNGSRAFGFWAHLDWDPKTELSTLRLLVDCDFGLLPFSIPLSLPTMGACVAHVLSVDDEAVNWEEDLFESEQNLAADLAVVMAMLNAMCQPHTLIQSVMGEVPLRSPIGVPLQMNKSTVRYVVSEAKVETLH